jgi:hypothetical protein
MADEMCGNCGIVQWAHDAEGGCPTQAQVTEFMEAAKAVVKLWDSPIANVTGQEDPQYGAPMKRLRVALKNMSRASSSTQGRK